MYYGFNMTTTNTAAIEALRAFAIDHNELPFAHLCTAALHQHNASWVSAHADAAKATGHREGCDCTECSLIREESVLASDAWAIERIAAPLRVWVVALTLPVIPTAMLDVIRTTDTAHPDDATPRSCPAPT